MDHSHPFHRPSLPVCESRGERERERGRESRESRVEAHWEGRPPPRPPPSTCALAGHADAEARRSVLTALPCATLVTVPTSLGPTDKRRAGRLTGKAAPLHLPPATRPRALLSAYRVHRSTNRVDLSTNQVLLSTKRVYLSTNRVYISTNVV